MSRWVLQAGRVLQWSAATVGYWAMARRRHLVLGILTIIASCSSGLAPSPAAAAGANRGATLGFALTSLSVAPATGLVDGEHVRVRISDGTYGTTYVVAECGPKALALLLTPSASPQDGCDSRHNTLVTVGANGTAATTLPLTAVLTTALGGTDCQKTACFLAVYALHYLGGARLLVHTLGFAANACSAPGSCRVPADAWDPSLGAPPAVSRGASPLVSRSGQGGLRGRPGAGPASGPGTLITPARPLVVALQAAEAGELTAAGSVNGPYAAGQPLTGKPLTGEPLTSTSTTLPAGEGLLRLALDAPGTSWGPGQPSSTVVDAALTDTTTGKLVSRQQFVLFWGAKPFVYAGFTGPVRTSDHYSLSVAVEPPAARGGLSQPVPGGTPIAKLLASALIVVSPDNPQYLAYAYAPVMYGRSTSALHDTPLLMYGNVQAERGGGHQISYVVVWSHEDAGTGFLPFVEWGRWGRMTDIEQVINLTVAPDGQVPKAQYLWGGEPATGFPDSQSALEEKNVRFTGAWWGHHPVLRDATGNNDMSDHGTTRFRFQLAPVAAPATGQLRDSVMDANPWTYKVMAEEVARWYADGSTNPASPQPGQPGQYAIIDMTTSGRGVSSVAVDLRLSGYPQWFRSDLGWGFPLVGAGHVRTVVKLPIGWSKTKVTAVQVAVEPPAAAQTVVVRSLRIERFNEATVQRVAAPAPKVVPEVLHVGGP